MPHENRFTKWRPFSCQLTAKDIEEIIILSSISGRKINGMDVTNAFLTADSWIEFFVNSETTMNRPRPLFRKR